MIGIFDQFNEGEVLEVVSHYGFSLNSPVHPPTVPRFKTLNELTARMSQVVTDFTGIPTNITAVYVPTTDYSPGSFMFGIEIQKSYQYGVSFSTSATLGDISKLSVKDSYLLIEGSFLISNEFGVILGSADDAGLKIVGTIDESNCTSSDQNVDFDIILGDKSPITHNIRILSCEEGVGARVDSVRRSVNELIGVEDVTVSLVGSSSLVLAFNPHWSKVEVYVPEENIYGLKNNTQKKSKWSFANGATAIELGLGVSGAAVLSAELLDSFEVAADIDASIRGDLQFNSGISGQLVPMDVWFSNIRSIFDPSDDFHDPDFASCIVSLDGDFGASVEVTRPEFLGSLTKTSVDGYFTRPFQLDLLDPTAVRSKKPDITLDIDIPNFGEIKNLSFGGIVKILQKALDFLVGDRDAGHSVESCSGGLLGKEIFGVNVFTYKIPILGFSVCDFAGFLQILVDAIDQLVNDCTECEDPDAPTSTFSVLETKLNLLLQDTVGGTPSVEFLPTSDEIRSSLEIDISLQWSFLEASQLKIDLASILEGMEIDDDLKDFIKGIVAFSGEGGIEIAGSIKFTLGIGLEYLKATETAIPYVKGVTGVSLDFSVDGTLCMLIQIIILIFHFHLRLQLFC